MCLSPPWLKLYLAEQQILKKMQLKLSEQRKWCLKLKASYTETILLCLKSQTTGWEANSFRWDQGYLKHCQHICLLSLLTNICQDRASRRSLGNPVYCLTVCPAGNSFASATRVLLWWTEPFSRSYPVWTQRRNCSFSICSTLKILKIILTSPALPSPELLTVGPHRSSTQQRERLYVSDDRPLHIYYLHYWLKYKVWSTTIPAPFPQAYY